MDIKKKVEEILGNNGRMISMSKGRYRFDNPDNIVIFNANICTKEDGKIFYGDIDITLEEQMLRELSTAIKKEVYVLYEMDARFENEEQPLLEKYIFKTDGVKSNLNSYEKIVIQTKEEICNKCEVSECGKCIYYDMSDEDIREFKESSKVRYELRSDGRWYYKKQEKNLKEKLPEYEETDKYKEDEFQYTMPYIMETFQYDGDTPYKGELDYIISPLEAFYNYISEGLKEVYSLTDEDLKECSVYITVEQEKKLTDYMKEYLIEYHGLEEGTYALQREMNWLPLSMPYTFYGSLKGPKWVKENICYIKRKS